MTSFNLNYLLKTLSPNIIILGDKASKYQWGGTQFILQNTVNLIRASCPPPTFTCFFPNNFLQYNQSDLLQTQIFTNMCVHIWPNNSTSRNLSYKYIYTHELELVLSVIVNYWKQFKCPLIGWLNSLWYIYTMEYYTVIQNSKYIEMERFPRHYSENKRTKQGTQQCVQCYHLCKQQMERICICLNVQRICLDICLLIYLLYPSTSLHLLRYLLRPSCLS